MRNLKLTTYEDKNGNYRWRCIAGNGKQNSRSPRGYKDYAVLMADLGVILGKPQDAELYEGKGDRGGKWRWRFRNADGKNIAIASEGYHNRVDCKEASDLFLDAEVV